MQTIGLLTWALIGRSVAFSAQPQSAPLATIDGTEYGWCPLTGDDFTNVNCDPETWIWSEQIARCTGNPTGVIRSKRQYSNFELLASWRHLQEGGNSGIFIWTRATALENLGRDELPRAGIEIQILDQGYQTQYESKGQKADWFTAHGDIFPVGSAKMRPFSPTSPNGERSFPRKRLSNGVGAWNQYYVRAINGEVRLWVNAHEVSGGSECTPKSGYLCLESEGAPVEFRNLRIRELP